MSRPPRGVTTGKPNNFREAWGKLFVYMRNYKYAVIAAIVMMVIATIMMLIGPNLIKDITNLITDGLKIETGFEINLEEIGRISMLLVIIYVISFVVSTVAAVAAAVFFFLAGRYKKKDAVEDLEELLKD